MHSTNVARKRPRIEPLAQISGPTRPNDSLNDGEQARERAEDERENRKYSHHPLTHFPKHKKVSPMRTSPENKRSERITPKRTKQEEEKVNSGQSEAYTRDPQSTPPKGDKSVSKK
jgi:hypothetical protein